MADIAVVANHDFLPVFSDFFFSNGKAFRFEISDRTLENDSTKVLLSEK